MVSCSCKQAPCWQPHSGYLVLIPQPVTLLPGRAMYPGPRRPVSFTCVKYYSFVGRSALWFLDRDLFKKVPQFRAWLCSTLVTEIRTSGANRDGAEPELYGHLYAGGWGQSGTRRGISGPVLRKWMPLQFPPGTVHDEICNSWTCSLCGGF